MDVDVIASAENPSGFMNPDGSFVENYHEKLGDEFANDGPILSTAKNIKGLAKSFVSTKRMVGKDPSTLVEIPKDDSSDEVKATFRKASGWSENLDDYKFELDPKLKDKVVVDENKLTAFKEFAHKELGLSPANYKKALDYFYNMVAKDIDDYGLLFEQQKQQAYDDGVKVLKQHLGTDQDVRAARAKALLQKFGEKPIKTKNGDIIPLEKLFEEVPALKNSPWMTIILDNIASSLSEDSLRGFTPPGAPTSTQIIDRINELQKHPAFMDRNHPEHKKIIAELNDLWRKKPKSA